MMPNRWPASSSRTGLTRQTTRRARMPTICLKTTSRPVVIDPDLAALVRGRRVAVVGRQVAAPAEIDARHAPGHGRTVHVHVHRRQEDADLLPLRPAARRPASAGPATSTRRRPATAPVRGSCGDTRSGSRKKNAKKAARTSSGTAPAEPTVRAAAIARAAVPPMKGYPARSIVTQTILIPISARSPAAPCERAGRARRDGGAGYLPSCP